MCYKDALCEWYDTTNGISCDIAADAQVITASVHGQNVWTHQATTQSARACCSSSVAEAVQEMNVELLPASEI